MRSYRVDTITRYLSPASEYWSRIKPTRIALVATPLAMQPTAYVRNSWADRKYGETPAVDAASVHDGETWAVHVGWSAPQARAGAEFPDAVAVALPVVREAVFALMGSQEAQIQYLRWDSRSKAVRSVLAGGIGNSAPGPDVKQTAQAVANGATWQVVIARTLGAVKNAAPLKAGGRTGIGFAVWRGANDERAGIKAFSVDWTELELDT